MASAYDHFRRCVEVARQNGLGRIEVANRSMIGFSRLYMNQLREALNDGAATVEAATQVGDQRAEMLGEMLTVFVLYETADYSQARRHNARALDIARQLGAPRFEAQCLMYEGKLALADGRREEALTTTDEALKISERVGHSFTGPRIMGTLARSRSEPPEKSAALREGERMLEAGSVSHNYFYFYPDAIEVSLEIDDWNEADRYATALEAFARSEPMPWSDFFIARGRALAAWGRGLRNPENIAEMQRLREEAERVGLNRALATIDRAFLRIQTRT
jgi:tetratricopeptide (TPR) repeat protein